MTTPGSHTRRPHDGRRVGSRRHESGHRETGHRETGHRETGRRRGAGAPVLLCSALAVAVLVLGASGTLSSWSQAIVNNSNDSVATATAVILQEIGPDGTAAHTSQTCRSSDTPATNSSTCTTINTYGGVSSPLVPGGSQTTDVTFTNLGSANASGFALAPGTCTSSPSSGTPTPTNLCTASGELTIAVSCSAGATYSAAAAWTDLGYAAGVAPTVTKTHAVAAGDLNAGAVWSCRFTATLSATASVLDQGVTLTQPLTWTLTK